MRYLVEINPRLWQRIQALVSEGRYESVAQFISVATENQMQYELRPLDQHHEELVTLDASEAANVALSTVGQPPEQPPLTQPPADASDEIVWGLYNRIFPIKITLRVLGRLLLSQGSQSVPLEALCEEAAIQAKLIAKQLAALDRNAGRLRGERLATGLPVRRADKSLDRFKNMFVGSVTSKGRADGFPALLRFIVLRREDDKRTAAWLTPPGYAFSRLESPVLDARADAPGGTLSPTEADFYMSHIKRILPREWELCRRVIEAIPEGKDTPVAIDGLLSESIPGLKESELGPTRAGLMSRLTELGLVRRRRDGLRVSYALTTRGEAYLKTVHEVTAAQ